MRRFERLTYATSDGRVDSDAARCGDCVGFAAFSRAMRWYCLERRLCLHQPRPRMTHGTARREIPARQTARKSFYWTAPHAPRLSSDARELPNNSSKHN